MSDNDKAPLTCDHRPGDEACELPGCNGTPPIGEPMDRDRTPVVVVPSGGIAHQFVGKQTGEGGGPEYCVDPCHRHRADAVHVAEPPGFETGDVTSGRKIMRAVAATTGFEVADGFAANNGWSDTRRGRRQVSGLMFTVDRFDVRVLSYEAQTDWRKWFAAVYVGQRQVDAAVDLERPGPQWQHEVVQAIAGEVERQHDARLLDLDIEDACLMLKNPPVGFVVDVPDRGNMTVNEASTNDGMTLRVLDADGQPRFIDRRSAGVWLTMRPKRVCSYTGCGGRHCWCGAALTGPQEPLGLAGGVCRRDCGHEQSRPPVGFTAGRYDHGDHTAALVHALSSSPTIVALGAGREGLANPTWCGLLRLPDGAQAWHTYGLKAETLTCPACFHLFTCPAATAPEGGGCPVCTHIDGCQDTACVLAHHPGFVPAPGSLAVPSVIPLADAEWGMYGEIGPGAGIYPDGAVLDKPERGYLVTPPRVYTGGEGGQSNPKWRGKPLLSIDLSWVGKGGGVGVYAFPDATFTVLDAPPDQPLTVPMRLGRRLPVADLNRGDVFTIADMPDTDPALRQVPFHVQRTPQLLGGVATVDVLPYGMGVTVRSLELPAYLWVSVADPRTAGWVGVEQQPADDDVDDVGALWGSVITG